MKKVRWGLIGCGDIARKRVATALQDQRNSELIAVSRADYSKADAFAREFGARQWHADWRDLVKNPEIDAVYIATPVNLHAEQTTAAAAQGKHILCEKPMAMSLIECERMITACQSASVKLGIAYYRRFYPVINRIKQLIREGDLGEVSLLQMNAFEYFDRRPGEPRDWLLQKQKSGGGPMMDFGCHRIEVMLNLLGPITRVKSMLSAKRLRPRDVEDTAVALMQFVGGAMGLLSVTHASFINQDTLHIYFTRGMLGVEMLNDGLLRIIDTAGERYEAHPPHKNLHVPLVQDFVRAVLTDTQPESNGECGLEVSRVLQSIYEGDVASGDSELS